MKKSHSARVLTVSAGGLSAQKVKPPQSQSLARGESPKPSSPLAQAEKPDTSTPNSAPSSNGGEKNVLTGNSVLDMRTFTATMNWALHFLYRRGKVKFAVERDANGDPSRYLVLYDAGEWVLTDENTLALKEEAK